MSNIITDTSNLLISKIINPLKSNIDTLSNTVKDFKPDVNNKIPTTLPLIKSITVAADSYNVTINEDKYGNSLNLREFDLEVSNYLVQQGLNINYIAYNGIYNNDFYTNTVFLNTWTHTTGLTGTASRDDIAKIYYRLKYIGEVDNYGYLHIKSYTMAFAYDENNNIIDTAREQCGYYYGNYLYNNIISRTRCFKDGVQNISLNFYYGTLYKDTKIILRGR